MTSAGRPDETPAERDDRNLMDLLQELRVATLGVQVLFGFLLGLPFTSRFDGLGGWQRWLYLAIMFVSAASIILLVAPVAYHRVLFRQHQLEHLIRAANILAICGLITVSLAVSGAVLLVTSYVEPGLPAALAAAASAVAFGTLWFVLPVVRRQGSRGPDARTAP